MSLPDVSVHGICIGLVCASKTWTVNQSVSVTEVSVVRVCIGLAYETCVKRKRVHNNILSITPC